MKIFVTGAAGFVGSAVVQELLGAGHEVLGLARSDANAKALTAAGAQVHRGDLNDPDSLRRGAAASEGVIHLAFIHDFANFAASAEADRVAIQTMGDELADSGRPFVVTSGTLLVQREHGAFATEEDEKPIAHFPRVSEQAGRAFAQRGVRASAVRLPPSVHGEGDHGFVPAIIGIAREKGASAYIGDGSNRWPSVHRLDAARVFRLALEKGKAGAIYHAVADQGVPTREIAEVIGRHLDLPVVAKSKEQAADHFGWMANFFGVDGPASSAQTQSQLGWRPTQIGLIADLDAGHYFDKVTA
jgi:nucleoside-diphosphate-sugar epimerase